MRITIRETKTEEKCSALILTSRKKDMPSKKDGWQFSWQQLYAEYSNAEFYKLVLTDEQSEIQGLLMLSILYSPVL